MTQEYKTTTEMAVELGFELQKKDLIIQAQEELIKFLDERYTALLNYDCVPFETEENSLKDIELHKKIEEAKK